MVEEAEAVVGVAVTMVVAGESVGTLAAMLRIQAACATMVEAASTVAMWKESG